MSKSHKPDTPDSHKSNKADRHESDVFYSKNHDTNTWYPGVKKDNTIYKCETTIQPHHDRTNYDIDIQKTTTTDTYEQVIPRKPVTNIETKLKVITPDKNTHIPILFCDFNDELTDDDFENGDVIKKQIIIRIQNEPKTWVKASIAMTSIKPNSYIIMQESRKTPIIEIGKEHVNELISLNGKRFFDFPKE
jgi:hypothetical protein